MIKNNKKETYLILQAFTFNPAKQPLQQTMTCKQRTYNNYREKQNNFSKQQWDAPSPKSLFEALHLNIAMASFENQNQLHFWSNNLHKLLNL